MNDSSERVTKPFLLAAGITGFLGVTAGTFGAHGLPEDFDPRMEEVFLTGVLYHMLHAVALLGCARLFRPGWQAKLALWGFSLGIVMFSGVLYVLALAGLKWLGMLAPIGGLLLLAGWIGIFAEAFRSSSD